MDGILYTLARLIGAAVAAILWLPVVLLLMVCSMLLIVLIAAKRRLGAIAGIPDSASGVHIGRGDPQQQMVEITIPLEWPLAIEATAMACPQQAAHIAYHLRVEAMRAAGQNMDAQPACHQPGYRQQRHEMN